jgi:hypothetical protein
MSAGEERDILVEWAVFLFFLSLQSFTIHHGSSLTLDRQLHIASDY